MEEQNKNIETIEPETQTEKEAEIKASKEIPQIAIIIGAIVAAVAIIAVLLIVLLGGDSHVHNYGEWEIAKEATFTEKGEERSYCSCGAYKSKELPKQDYNETKYAEAMALIVSKDYSGAYEILFDLSNYDPAIQELKKFHYVPTKQVYKMEIQCNSQEYGCTTYAYGSDNLPIQAITSIDDRVDIYNYTYDENGKISKIELINYGGYSSTIDCVYDAHENIIKKVLTSYDGDKSTIDYTYDESGNLINKIGIGQTDNYTYDASGKLIKIVSMYAGGSQKIDDYTYDVSGKLIKIVSTASDGSKRVDNYTYDIYGNLIKMISTYDNNYKEISDYTYDTNGNTIKFVYTSHDGSKNISESRYELVYIPFEFSDEELDELWNNLLTFS